MTIVSDDQFELSADAVGGGGCTFTGTAGVGAGY